MKKATKIIGAVVGVLLVAALFTGAVAAAPSIDNATNLGDFEVWNLYSLNDFMAPWGLAFGTEATLLNAEWKDELGNTVKFEKDPTQTAEVTNPAVKAFYINGNEAVDGVYYNTVKGNNNIVMINVKHLAAPAKAFFGEYDATATPAFTALAPLNGADVDAGKFFIQIPDVTTPNAYLWVNPDGSLSTTKPEKLGFGVNDHPVYDPSGVEDLGEYTVYAAVTPAGDGTDGYASIAPATILGDAITFNLYNSKNSMTLTALSDEVIQGNYVTLELTAPYNPQGYEVTELKYASIPEGQVDVIDASGSDKPKIKVGLGGVAYFVVKSEDKENIKITVKGTPEGSTTELKKSITIKVVPGKISAEAIPAITNIGNEIDIIGTNELGAGLNLFMKGENYFKEIGKDPRGGSADNPIEKVTALDKDISGKEFTVTLNTGDLNADAGYYTLYLAKLVDPVQDMDNTTTIKNTDDFADSNKCEAYTTISIKLVPSFISITEMPTYAVIGEEFVVKGTAEGKPGEVQSYVFGNNYYDVKKVNVEDDNTFEISIKPADAMMEAGQYFLVIQHPMYNKEFNVGPDMSDTTDDDLKATILVDKTADVSDPDENVSTLFVVDKRQTTNAAYALCRAIDGDEDIDDMYVKRSFNVVDKSSIINAIPGQVAQGDALVVSGTARGYTHSAVAVTISTGGAFDATSKSDAGSATGSFAEVTSVAADGSWSVSFDTTEIPVGEYQVTVKVGTASTSEPKDLKVVQGTTPKPTQTGAEPTTAPTTAPTQTPASPGFGILAALAGLGAVAVLLLRRQ